MLSPNDLHSDVIVKKDPTNHDENMMAQAGHFSLVKQNMADAKKKFKIITLDDIENANNLWKLQVPKTEAFNLLSKCDDNGVNAESVYKGKGLDGVALSYRESEILQSELCSNYDTILKDGLDEV